MWPLRKLMPASAMSGSLPRSEVLRRGRIAVLDDEMPEMLDDLRAHGLAIDHIRSTDDPAFHKLGTAFYDVLLLDYGGIGARFGPNEGLDVLRYVKRVNPSLRVLAFTARTFDASKGDFFRLCDGILKKDAGITETLEKLESHLSQVLTAAYQVSALTKALGLSGSQAEDIERAISKAIARPRRQGKAIELAKRLAKAGSEQLIELLVIKAIELGVAGVAF